MCVMNINQSAFERPSPSRSDALWMSFNGGFLRKIDWVKVRVPISGSDTLDTIQEYQNFKNLPKWRKNFFSKNCFEWISIGSDFSKINFKSSKHPLRHPNTPETIEINFWNTWNLNSFLTIFLESSELRIALVVCFDVFKNKFVNDDSRRTTDGFIKDVYNSWENISQEEFQNSIEGRRKNQNLLCE